MRAIKSPQGETPHHVPLALLVLGLLYGQVLAQHPPKAGSMETENPFHPQVGSPSVGPDKELRAMVLAGHLPILGFSPHHLGPRL